MWCSISSAAPYFPASIEAMAPLGRLMVIGTLAGREAMIPLGRVLSSRITIRGTMLRGRALEEKIAATRAFEEQVVPLFAARRAARGGRSRAPARRRARGPHADGVERVHRKNRTAHFVIRGRLALADWRGYRWPRARRRCSRTIEVLAPTTSTAGTSSTRSRSRSSSHRSSRAGSSRGIEGSGPTAPRSPSQHRRLAWAVACFV